MGVYLYMARKSKPIVAMAQGKRVQIHRYNFVTKACCFDDVPNRLRRVVGRIDSAWGDSVPKLSVCIDNAADVTFNLVEAPKSIYWWDCDSLGESVGYLTRNLAGQLVLLSMQEFDAIIEKVTGYANGKELLKSKADIVLNQATDEGKAIAAFCKEHYYGGRILTAWDIDAENFVG